MKKLFFSIVFIVFIIFTFVIGFQPVKAESQEVTIECFIRSMIHIDGDFSQKEKDFFLTKLKMPPEYIESMKVDCLTSQNKILEDLRKITSRDEAVMALVKAAYTAKADGTVTSQERTLLEDLLEVFGKKRKSQPLLDICEGDISPELIDKISTMYSFTSSYAETRAEVPQMVKAIKIAQISYMQDYDVYVRCSAYPPNPSKEPQQWDVQASGGFKVIDFSPNGNVRGSYMVSTTSTNFTVTGIIDVDGDGVFATYTATKTENPNAPITAPDIY